MNEEKNVMPEITAEDYRRWWMDERKRANKFGEQIEEMKAEHEKKVKEMEDRIDTLTGILSDAVTNLYDAREERSYQNGRADGILDVFKLIYGYWDEEDDDPVEEDGEEDGEDAE